MQHREQIGLRPRLGPESPRAQFTADRNERHEHKPDRREMPEPGEIVGPVRIHQRVHVRQFVAALMVVDDDHGHAEPLGLGQRLDAGRAAIDGDEQRRAFLREPANGFDVWAVAFEDTIGNMDQRIEPGMTQMPGEQRRRRCAVHVVVAEDRDTLALDHRVGDTPRRRLHIRQRIWIWHQLADGRIEKVPDRIDRDVSPGNDARQHLRQIVTLGDGERLRRAARVQPVAPQPSRCRLRHAEKGVVPVEDAGHGRHSI